MIMTDSSIMPCKFLGDNHAGLQVVITLEQSTPITKSKAKVWRRRRMRRRRRSAIVDFLHLYSFRLSMIGRLRSRMLI